jgi:precorrin-6B methylase 2
MTGPAYRLSDYGRMIADEGRTGAYAESLKRLVTPRSVVVDIGTGTGIFALLAARLGARKVYAIEPSDVIEFGRLVAAQNGLDERVEFIQGLSTDVQLPESADIIVFDIHGILPANERSLSAIMDARDRFLAPGGALIPRRETMWASLVEAAALHHENVGVLAGEVFGIDMTAMSSSVANIWHKGRARPAELVTTPACWAVLDYAILRSPNVRGRPRGKSAIGAPHTASASGSIGKAPKMRPFPTRRFPASATCLDRRFFPGPSRSTCVLVMTFGSSCDRTLWARVTSTRGKRSYVARTARRRRRFSSPTSSAHRCLPNASESSRARPR